MQSMLLGKRLPQFHGRWEHVIGIAHDVDEARIRKHLQQGRYATRMRRRLEDKLPLILEGQRLNKTVEGSFPVA